VGARFRGPVRILGLCPFQDGRSQGGLPLSPGTLPSGTIDSFPCPHTSLEVSFVGGWNRNKFGDFFGGDVADDGRETRADDIFNSCWILVC
jgi:hypothetical protein